MIGWSSGLDFEITGGSMSRGSWRWACETLVVTSWSARSTSRARSSSTVTDPEPWRDDEVSERTPSTWTSASSRISMTSFSITSGAAPSQATFTEMVGKSTSGSWLMPMRLAATRPKTTVPAISIQARTGLRMQASVSFIWVHPWSFSGLSFLRSGGGRRGGRSRVLDPHGGAVAQRLGAAHHQTLAGLEAGAHLDQPVGGAQPELEDALARQAFLDHEGEEAALGGAHRGLRDDRGVAAPAHRDGDLGEGAGAQLAALRIVDARRGLHHTRGPRGLDGDMGDLGAVAVIAAADGESGALPGRDRRRLLLGDLEAQQQRLAAHQSGDHRARLHVLAGLRGAGLDQPGHGGAHEGVARSEERRVGKECN